MTAQALLGQTYPSHAASRTGLDERRQVLNHHLPKCFQVRDAEM